MASITPAGAGIIRQTTARYTLHFHGVSAEDVAAIIARERIEG